MKSPFLAALFGSACAFVWPQQSGAQPVQAPDVSARVEKLGSPSSERYPTQFYARNVWDLHFFGGRLYVGGGNSSNVGPQTNAGPVPIWSFDPQTRAFKSEFQVDDEQTDVFRTLNGRLVVPGHDAREDWSLGNFYRLEGDGWKKFRTVPRAVHVYDMGFFAGRFVAAIGSDQPVQLATSSDDGQKWQQIPSDIGRAFSLCEFENHLLSFGTLAPQRVLDMVGALPEGDRRERAMRSLQNRAGEFDAAGAFSPRPDLSSDALFPGLGLKELPMNLKVARPTSWKEHLLYIGGTPHNDHQTDPLGAFVADSLRPGHIKTARIVLGASEKPWDIVATTNAVYILTSEKIARADAPDEFIVRVWMSRDTQFWTPLLQFSAPTFARSLEFDGRNFYFGLGTDVGPGFEDIPSYTREMRPESGQIWRVAVVGR